MHRTNYKFLYIEQGFVKIQYHLKQQNACQVLVKLPYWNKTFFSTLDPDLQSSTHRYNNDYYYDYYCFSSYGVWECLKINTDCDSRNSYNTFA
jgi:hypothetical protein